MVTLAAAALLGGGWFAAAFVFRRAACGPWQFCAWAVAAVCLASGLAYGLRAGEQPPSKRAAGAAEPAAPAAPTAAAKSTAERKLVAPENWPAGHPLPTVASNCAACHLTAGRELTQAVQDFVRSVHDRNGLTCYDCHGGNRDDDVRAHEEEFHFIGTKISAHLKTCSECHAGEAEQLAAGPHHWDFAKRVNLEYPTCVDCHGNHDIGNPPEDFKLTAMCQDCHETLDKDYPRLASIVAHNDELAAVLRDVQEKNIDHDDPIPESFRQPVAALRTATMQVVHASREVPDETARRLNDQSQKVRAALLEWLQSEESSDRGK